MSEHDQHSSFIKTPQQLITVVLLAFVVPIIGIVMLVQLVVNRPQADPAALSPEAVAARLQPAGKVEFGAAAGAGAAKSGEQIAQEVCAACHQTGVANAPKTGDKAAWAPRVKSGMAALYASALKGKNAMPPKGGNMGLAEADVRAAVDYLAGLAK